MKLADYQSDPFYAPAYIEIEEVPHTSEFNATPTLPFELNAGTIFNPITSLDDSQDMSGADRKEYWYTLLVVGYQYRIPKDNDPAGEGLVRGLTVGGSLIFPKFSSIYVEGIRDWIAGNRNDTDFMNKLQRDMSRVAAHEIAHGPANKDDGLFTAKNDADHNEHGLMGESADDDDFTPKTIFRFRSAPQWQY